VRPALVDSGDRFRSVRMVFVGLLIVTAAQALVLRLEGRSWWCPCGQTFLWTGEPLGRHNSRHLLDPYTFTHVLHGIAFCGLAAWLLPRMRFGWRLLLASVVEAAWEVIENTDFVIDRYRKTTFSLDYQGDSIANSVADMVACALGFVLAARLGWRLSIMLFVSIELILIVWIRDSLTLNIIMLLYPLDAIRAWQSGG
jgi:hypothetical protein